MNGFVIILIVLVVGIFVLAEIYDSIVMDEFDPVCEERCKKCINYPVCMEHGCHYQCDNYCTEEDLAEEVRTKSANNKV